MPEKEKHDTDTLELDMEFLESFYADIFAVAGASWPRFVALMEELVAR